MKTQDSKLPEKLIDPVPALRADDTFIIMQRKDTLKKPFSDLSPIILWTNGRQSDILYLGSAISHMAVEWEPVLGTTLEEHNIVLK